MSTTAPPSQQPWLEVSEAEDGLIVFDPTRERVHHLNGTAALVFELCNGEYAVETIADVVMNVFTEGAVGEADTHACIETLVAEGLIS